MSKSEAIARSIRPIGTELFFLPVHTRMPLKFGGETVDFVTCARCRVTVRDRHGKVAAGWGETPLSVTWLWPSKRPYEERHVALKEFCRIIAKAWAEFDCDGHAFEIGHDFVRQQLPALQAEHNRRLAESGGEPMPWLAALVCCSLFDIALHDAYGNLHGTDIYSTYTADWMQRSLGEFLEPKPAFKNQFPCDFPDQVTIVTVTGVALGRRS